MTSQKVDVNIELKKQRSAPVKQAVPQPRKLTLADLTKGKEIGAGSYGTVTRV
jgi:hypothetical protein